MGEFVNISDSEETLMLNTVFIEPIKVENQEEDLSFTKDMEFSSTYEIKSKMEYLQDINAELGDLDNDLVLQNYYSMFQFVSFSIQKLKLFLIVVDLIHFYSYGFFVKMLIRMSLNIL